MAFKSIHSASILGLEVHAVGIEVNIDNRGYPRFDIVGLAAREINESKERIKAAIRNAGYKFPSKKILVNLTPADLPKSGAHYDLPVAVGILGASGIIDTDLSGFMFVGELSLEGVISKISGATIIACEAKARNKILIIPESNLSDVILVKGLKFLAYKRLSDLILDLQNKRFRYRRLTDNYDRHAAATFRSENLIENIKGQAFAKRALLIAAAGRHSICLIGSAGSGKTILAKSLESIMPPPDEEDFIEIKKIASITKDSFLPPLPFRSPNHPITQRNLLGSGVPLTLGEITYAHKGILLIDEFTECSDRLINCLRQALDNKKYQITTQRQIVTVPADFMLVLSANPCACGNYGDTDKKCICSNAQIQKYLVKLRSPLMDRIDIFLNVFSISSSELNESSENLDTSEKIKGFLIELRDIQSQRREVLKLKSRNNADFTSEEIRRVCTMQNEALETLNTLNKKYSSRSIHKIMKVARTIADIENSADIKNTHLLEAIQYKSYMT